MAADDRVSRESGVRMTNSTFFFPYMLESNAKQMNKFYEMRRAGVRGLRRDVGLISGAGVGPEYGAVDAYELCVPCIDTDACMSFLLSLVRSKGCALITHTVSGDLFYQEQALREAFSADVIVNCSGLASLELASDKSCYPLRGALLRVINDGRDFPKVESALAVAKDVGGDGEIVFIVPRNDNILLLGGIAQKGEWELDLKVDSDTVKRMRERCEKFLPALKNARLDEEYPLAQGLRPCRVRNVRVERELRVHYAGLGRHGRGIPSRIVHNYGHGGAGWSLSFGCAEEVAGLVQEALRDMDAKPMGSEEFVVRSRL
jgi:glycine/D-amino acid oxidase-like deaminating enzyme